MNATKKLGKYGVPLLAVVLAVGVVAGVSAMIWQGQAKMDVVKAGQITTNLPLNEESPITIIEGSTVTGYYLNVTNPDSRPMTYTLSIETTGGSGVTMNVDPSLTATVQPSKSVNWTVSFSASSGATSTVYLLYTVYQATN